MKTITIYNPQPNLDCIEDLQKIVSICYIRPEDRCICPKCYQYKVTIDEIGDAREILKEILEDKDA